MDGLCPLSYFSLGIGVDSGTGVWPRVRPGFGTLVGLQACSAQPWLAEEVARSVDGSGPSVRRYQTVLSVRVGGVYGAWLAPCSAVAFLASFAKMLVP